MCWGIMWVGGFIGVRLWMGWGFRWDWDHVDCGFFIGVGNFVVGGLIVVGYWVEWGFGWVSGLGWVLELELGWGLSVVGVEG